ncbi:MAG: hypothetical protein K940chlam9_01210 [Chlamydiae bacterium]|nr:hypothetical protein [Chlamydiota bacterium]
MRRLFLIGLVGIVGTLGAEGDVKERIAGYHTALEMAHGAEESLVHYQLAMAYLEDQELDRAFLHFLKALEKVEREAAPPMSVEEKKLYEEALGLYLAQSGQNPLEMGHQLLEKYEGVTSKHSEYLYLNFLLSAAYANMERFEEFFKCFYAAFPKMHDLFLADKISGILYLRIAKREADRELAKTYREKAISSLSEALEKNPEDPGLYKTLLFLAKDEKNTPLVRTYLEKIVAHRVPIARGDLSFYVQEAVALGEKGLGQSILDQARLRYDYSRAIERTQQYLEKS